MAKKEFRPLFGMKADTWTKIDGVSTILFTAVISRRALQGIGENGFFGIGKNKTLAKLNFGASDKTWTYIDTISTALWAVTLLHGAIDTYEEMNNIPDNKQLIPGRGIVYSGYKWIDTNVF
jgi:hypothetical protein|tara:strand:+ start:4274 stop:4636 length:363 start_codon:yes stop_codon:yes gene_type:complete